MKIQPKTHDRSSIIETYARSRSLRAAAKELQLPLALVIDTVREAGVMRRPGAVFLGQKRPELQGKREPSTHQGTASPQEIVAHYLQGYGTHATSIMLDVPEWRVREAVLDAGVQRAPSGKGGLVFSLKHGDFVARDFVWDLDDIVARRARGETWGRIHKELGVTWHIESLIRHVTTERPSIKTRGRECTPARQLTPEQLESALQANANGDTHRQIAVRLGVSLSHYYRQLAAYKGIARS